MATRTTRYRSHSPTSSPTHHHYSHNNGYEQQQPQQAATTISPAGPPTTYLPAMTLDTRSPHELGYGARSEHITLPPFSKNLVLGSAGPGSLPRYHSSNANGYPLSPPRDLKSYSRSKQNQNQHQQHRSSSATIPEGHQPQYHYEEGGYSEFSQTVPVVDLHSFTPAPLSFSQNGPQSRSLPPLNPSMYSSPAQTYAPPPPPPQKLDSHHRQRQLSINSIISSPGPESSPSPRFNNLASPPPAHGNGTLKKRKKSFEADDAERQDASDREKDSACGKGVGMGLGLEDPDVRLAAEALGDLRADFNHGATSSRRLHLSTSGLSSTSSSNNNTRLNSPLSPSSSVQQKEQEAPLLDLIQSNPNPVLRAASAAGRLSAAAYTTSKAFSPRWKYAAESVESVAKGPLGLVSKVGKSSGLEGLMRRSLGGGNGALEGEDMRAENAGYARRSASGPPQSAVGSKKRKTSNAGDMEVSGNGSGNEVATLKKVPEEQKALQQQRPQQEFPNTWQTRLISTSGLGVMSEESLKSLKFCLEWLRWANNHLAKCVETLKAVLEEYQRTQKKSLTNSETPQSTGGSPSTTTISSAPQTANPGAANSGPDRKNFLMGRMEALKAEVLKTLKRVITIVDNYAGSALVGETRAMVKRQLLLLPDRLQIALVAHTPEGENSSAPSTPGGNRAGSTIPPDPSSAAQKVIIVAKEGLAMVASVSKVVEIALKGAEEWCEKFGGPRKDSTAGSANPTTSSVATTNTANTTPAGAVTTEKQGAKLDADAAAAAEAQQRKLSVATTLVVLGSDATAAANAAAAVKERDGEKSGEVQVGVDSDGDVTMES